MPDAVLDKLDELIRVTRITARGDLYLDTRGVADLLCRSYSHTRNVIVNAPDFPAPLDDGGHKRWRKSRVLEWAAGREKSA